MSDHPTTPTTEDCPNGACPGRMMCLDCSDTSTTGAPVCEACGEPATQQDCEGVWLCEDDYNHMINHWVQEENPNG
jgi:hypothetical protein